MIHAYMPTCLRAYMPTSPTLPTHPMAHAPECVRALVCMRGARARACMHRTAVQHITARHGMAN